MALADRPNIAASELASDISRLVLAAQRNIARANDASKHRYDLRRRVLEFGVEEYVWVSSRYLTLPGSKTFK